MPSGMVNIMQKDREYLVFLNTYDYAPDYYNEYMLGALCLSDSVSEELIDITKEYNYGDLAAFDFFADNKDTLEQLYKAKEEVLKEYRLISK